MATATYVHDGEAIDHIPTSDLAAGQVVVQGSLVGITKRPITADTLGALAVMGVFDVPKTNEQIDPGTPVYWDADGDPVGGVAGTGAATATATDNVLMGKSVKAATAGDAKVRLRLSQ